MNWDDLRAFLEVSRHSRLELAAARLKIDATTLSRRLKRLERDTGLTLFERTRRGHLLSQDGEIFAQRAEAMEATALKLMETSNTDAGQVSGAVRVGVTEGLGASIIAPAINAFVEAYPQVHVDLIALSGFVSVPRRQADMSILLTRPKTGRLKVRKLSDYTLGLYASEAYLQAHRAIETPQDLIDHRLIGYVDDLIYAPQLRYYDEVLSGLSPTLCSPSILAQLAMTASGAGVAILPDFMARRQTGLRALLTDAIQVQRTFWLAVHEDVYDFARVRSMIDFLVDTMRANEQRLSPNSKSSS